ncbi:MAG: hypothetical protein LBW85_01520 [Deltaproteobacteria bacterium]|jgi:hypothetical protein|nr:hypothetical protein [Deltaproteobacteria bacterium]
MISSLLSLANNALAGSPYRAFARPAAPVGAASYYDEKEAKEAESNARRPTGPASAEDRFSGSLAARLKETGLTGPESAERIARVTAQAREVISRIRREDGIAESNRAKAQILSSATAENAEAVLGAVASGTSGFKAGPAEAAEEIAARAAEKLAAEEAAEAAEKADEGNEEAAVSLSGAGPASGGAAAAVLAAISETGGAFPEAARADAGTGFISLVRKAEAGEAPQAAAGFAAGRGDADAAIPRAYQAAYANRLPNPGSLLSVRI